MGRQQRTLLAVLGAGALAAGSLGCAGEESRARSAAGPPSAVAALRTARAYVAAYNARDGQRACRLLDPAIALAAVRSADEGAADCARFLTREIGSHRPGDEEYGEWRAARIVRARPVEVDGRRAVVRLRLRHRLVGGVEGIGEDPWRYTEADALHLVARDGRWLLSKPGRILYTALGVATSSQPATVLDAPGDTGSLRRAAPLPRRRFACKGRSLRVPDPTGDVVVGRRGGSGVAP